MKKLIIFTILLQNILFANPNALNQATIEDIMQERQEEVERIMATRQQSGESLFTQKPTIENKDKYISNNVSINNTSSNIDNYPQMQYEQQYSQEIPAYTEEQLLLMKQAIRNKDLRAVQKKFLEKNIQDLKTQYKFLMKRIKHRKYAHASQWQPPLFLKVR